MLKLAFAVLKIHNLGIGHFDIKGPNILMENIFTPVLGDFGFMQTFKEA